MYCFKLVNLDPARLSKVKWILESGLINKDVWLAGGALRTLIDPKDEICDYDLFFKYSTSWIDDSFDIKYNHLEQVKQTREKLINLGFKCTFECPEGKLYSYTKYKSVGQDEWEEQYKVQLICEKFYSNPVELLQEFDLTPTLFCTDGEFLCTDRRGIKAVKKKHCQLVALTHPVSTIRRIIKYSNKGYWVNDAIKSIVSNLIERTNILSEDDMRVYID